MWSCLRGVRLMPIEWLTVHTGPNPCVCDYKWQLLAWLLGGKFPMGKDVPSPSIGDCPIEPQWNEWISNCHVWLPEGNMILYSVCTASIVLLVYYIKFSPKKNMVVFHSYVWLPEGKSPSNPIKPQFSFGFPHMCDVTKGRGAKPATLRHGSAWSPVMGQRCDSGIPCIDR